ncbi:MAG: hypothetical protein ABI779_24505 [Acidobacteriota bacterium]
MFDATLFVVVHVVVLLFLFASVRRLLHETRSLSSWEPGQAARGAAATILQSFSEESARLGARGFVVPMTDYSDRLDAIIQNLTEEVSERTNLLLVVGIGGTIFGVFEFAARVVALPPGDRVTLMAAALSESIAKAFPVGFVGLALMLLAQLVTARPIARIHDEATKATTRALLRRGEVSQTLPDAIAASVGEAMAPLSSLGETVSHHLQPVVEALGQRLDESLSLVKAQFIGIDQSTERFSEATASLQESVRTLTSTSSDLARLLESTPAVLAETASLQSLQRQALDQISSAFSRNLQMAEELTVSLKGISTSAMALPDALIRKTSEAIEPAFARMTGEALATWGTLLQSMATDLQTDYTSFVGNTRIEIAAIHGEIRAAATEWRRLAGESEALLSEPIRNAVGEISKASLHVLGITGDLAQSMSTVQKGMTELPDRLAASTAAAVQPAFERMAAQSVETWQGLVRTVTVDLQQEYEAFVRGTRAEIDHVNEGLRSAADEWQRLARKSESLISEPLQKGLDDISAGSARVMESAVGLAGSMTTLQAEMAGMPEQFLTQTAAAIVPAFERVAAQSVSTWQDLVRSVAVELQNDYATYVAKATEEIAKVNTQLGDAAREWQRLAQNSQALLEEPIQTAIKTAREEASTILSELDSFVRDRYPALKADMEALRVEAQSATAAVAAVEQRVRAVNLQQATDSTTTPDLLRQILGALQQSAAAGTRARWNWRSILPWNWFRD